MDNKCGGALELVHRLPHTICCDSVQPCMNFAKNIASFERTNPNCAEKPAFKRRPITRRSFVG